MGGADHKKGNEEKNADDDRCRPAQNDAGPSTLGPPRPRRAGGHRHTPLLHVIALIAPVVTPGIAIAVTCITFNIDLRENRAKDIRVGIRKQR